MVHTLGPIVADLCATAGYAPYPEQELLLDLTFAVAPDGEQLLPLVTEVDALAPRQVLKTGFIKQCEIGWLFVTEEPFMMHTAHELDTTQKAFAELADLIESTPSLSRRMAPTRGERQGIVEQTGKWSITTARGANLRYKARTNASARGLSGRKLVLDEALRLTERMMGAIIPTMAAIPSSQLVLASSAGELDSAALRAIRDRGRLGMSPDVAYLEWGDRAPGGCEQGARCTHKAGAARGCALDDEARWARIIPGLGQRITLRKMRWFRQTLPPAEFMREFMMWHEDPPTTLTGSAMNTSSWAKLRNRKAQQPDGEVVLSVDVNPDRSRAAIGVAGAGRKDRTLVMVKTGAGTDWVVPKLQKLVEKHDVTEVVLYPSGQAGHLIPEIEAADLGVELVRLTQTQIGQACAAFQEGVKRRLLEHVGQPELDEAVAAARTRTFGEAEVFDRQNYTDEISPLIAVSEAAWRFSLVAAENSGFNIW